MTIVSFPNRVKYGGVMHAPHVSIEVADVDVAEMVSKGAHVLQHVPDEVEQVKFVDVPDGEEGDVEDDKKVKDGAEEGDVSDGPEPPADKDDDLGDEDAPVVVPPVKPEEKPSRRNQAKK